MKKNLILAIKILLSIIFAVGAGWNIYLLCNGYYCEGGIILIAVALTFFSFYLLTWLAPKFTFNVCWRMFSRLSEDNFDYEQGYRNIEKVSLRLLITAVIFLVTGLTVTLFV